MRCKLKPFIKCSWHPSRKENDESANVVCLVVYLQNISMGQERVYLLRSCWCKHANILMSGAEDIWLNYFLPTASVSLEPTRCRPLPLALLGGICNPMLGGIFSSGAGLPSSTDTQQRKGCPQEHPHP